MIVLVAAVSGLKDDDKISSVVDKQLALLETKGKGMVHDRTFMSLKPKIKELEESFGKSFCKSHKKE